MTEPAPPESHRQASAKQYACLKRRLWLIHLVASLLFLIWLVASRFSIRLEDWVLAHLAAPWPWQVAAYLSVLWAGATLLFFPLDWFGSFVIEQRFQLSNQRLGQWLWEYGKRWLLGSVIGLVLVEVLSGFLRWFPSTWWLWATAGWMFWEILLARVLPTLLIPIFYQQKPLPDEPLSKRLSFFAQRCGAAVNGIFEINLSKTTKKANAMLCGLGKTRRILISDTLLSKYPAQEIETVLAHEVGHHRLHHIGILLVAGTLVSSVSFLAVDQLCRALGQSCGIGSLSELAALPLIGLGLFIANFILMPILNGFSRRLEKQADWFALEQTKDPAAFIQTMNRLADQNLAERQPPRWVEWLLYDHPAIAKRIAVAERWAS